MYWKRKHIRSLKHLFHGSKLVLVLMTSSPQCRLHVRQYKNSIDDWSDTGLMRFAFLVKSFCLRSGQNDSRPQGTIFR
jgi:hypothetical protein